MKSHDAITWLGLTMFGGSLWVLHPALTIGFAGLVLVASGVWISKQSNVKKS